MGTIQLNYGHGALLYNYSDKLNIKVIYPNYHRALKNPQNKIKYLLENSGYFRFSENHTSNSHVAIAINDQTRPVPNEILIPPLIKYLRKQGFSNNDIQFFIATGTHSPLEKALFREILPSDIIKSFQILSHDCDDHKNLIFLGKTKLGTPVEINAEYLSADIKIVIGNIEPHHYQGYSGGAKSAAIGLASRETINENHKWLMDSRSFIGSYENNPCRQDVEEIGEMIGISAALNVVLNQDKKIFDVFWGHPRAVMSAGIPVSRKICQIFVEKKYDLVIASPGGYPKDINLYQSQKAITHASLITKENGVIILLAECVQGFGNSHFEKYLDGKHGFSDVINSFENSKFTIGPHKAYQLAQQVSKNKLILVSGMSFKDVKKAMLMSADSLDNALTIARDYLPEDPEIAVLPFATNTIPLVT